MTLCLRNRCVLPEGHQGRHQDEAGEELWEKADLPVLIIATSKEAGELYAKDLLVPNYKIATSVPEVQGWPIRSIIIAPAYLEAASNAYYDRLDTYFAGMQTVSLHTTNLG